MCLFLDGPINADRPSSNLLVSRLLGTEWICWLVSGIPRYFSIFIHFWFIFWRFFFHITWSGPATLLHPKEVFAEGGRTLVLDPRPGDGFCTEFFVLTDSSESPGPKSPRMLPALSKSNWNDIPIYPNVSQYIPIYPNISQYIPIYPNISQYIPIYSNIFQNIPIYSNIFQYIPIYSNMSTNFEFMVCWPYLSEFGYILDFTVCWASVLSGAKRHGFQWRYSQHNLSIVRFSPQSCPISIASQWHHGNSQEFLPSNYIPSTIPNTSWDIHGYPIEFRDLFPLIERFYIPWIALNCYPSITLVITSTHIYILYTLYYTHH